MNIAYEADYLEWLFLEGDTAEYLYRANALLKYLNSNRKELDIPEDCVIAIEDGSIVFYTSLGIVDLKLTKRLTNK